MDVRGPRGTGRDRNVEESHPSWSGTRRRVPVVSRDLSDPTGEWVIKARYGLGRGPVSGFLKTVEGVGCAEGGVVWGELIVSNVAVSVTTVEKPGDQWRCVGVVGLVTTTSMFRGE